MARILSFQKATFDRTSIHDPVAECLYDFYDVNGKRYLQINTYGRAGRKTPEKPSQVLQLDVDSAGQLRKLLDDVFGDRIR